MKKSFIVCLGIFIILFLIYIFQDKDLIKDSEYKEDNIRIIYPFFNNETIDEYISDYLQGIIKDFKKNSNNDNMYMDYDYFGDETELNLTFYKYVLTGNIVKETKDNYLIKVTNNSIDKNNILSTSNYIYDGYYQKFIDKSKPMVAFTFDDGPNYNTSKIIDILNKYNVKATFFLLGTNIKGNEDVIKKMASSGMEIGNHTYSHKLLTRLKKEQIEEEFKKTNDLIFEIIGKYPTLTRPSYGSTSNKIRNVVDTPIIIWDIDTLDWKYHNSNRIYNKVIDKVSDGDIILMHDIYSATANSLEMIIPKLLEQGYQLVTVTELFYYKDIELKPGKVYGLAK